MSEATVQSTSSQPLRQIVRPIRVARQRKMTIGRIATNSQMMANSFGRSTSIRRSVANDSSVLIPTWLLPALPTRADDLDPYRDRDIIALRQSRMKNRVVRQVQPRGLPMAAHAHGRSRSGVQTGPSSIARRLHPIRRQPNRNEAHIGPTSAPFVRVATQPQRPTARPPRTRSTDSPTRNGNRTDRDGPTPRTSVSFTGNRLSSKENEPSSVQVSGTHSLLAPPTSPKFDSVMVARSLLTRPPSSPKNLNSVASAETDVLSHRLALPRVSERSSIDRSAIHRRRPSTHQPLVLPSHRIPLSMMYEAPRRFSAPQSAATHTPIMRSSPTTVSRSATKTMTADSTSNSRKMNESPASTSSGPNWTSFPTRDSSKEQVSRKVDSTTSAVTIALAPTSLTPSLSLASLGSQQIPSPGEPLNTAHSSSRNSNSITIENRVHSPSANTAAVRRRTRSRTVSIPQSAGWRQVVGLSAENALLPTSRAVSNNQDSLFRRVAALANPTNAPLGTPGDIARRSPVSGSLISVASAMRTAVQTQRESTPPNSSSHVEHPNDSRKSKRRSVSPSSRMNNSATTSDARNPDVPVERLERAAAPSEVMLRSSQRQVKNSTSVNTQSPSAMSRTTLSRRSPRDQRLNTSATSLVQIPSFVDLWSSVNQSVARQSDLIARRSLRLPQVRVHSMSSKPGTIARQQFGLNDRSTEAFEQSSHSTVLDLRRRKNQRASRALLGASQGNPSSARVLSIARESRSHMSSVTPGASSGTQFAGSLAQAISRRQTHGDTARYEALMTPRETAGAVRRSTTTAAIQRSAAPHGSSSSRVMPSESASLTGAGSHVAQNFLDRLSKKTGEDFAPVINTNQDRSASASTNSDVIARSVAPSSRIDRTRGQSLPLSEQSNDSPRFEQHNDQPHWAVMRTPVTADDLGEGAMISNRPNVAESSDRAARAMGDDASVTNASIMRSVVANPVAARSSNQPEPRALTTRHLQRSISQPSTTQSSKAQSSRAQASPSQSLTTASRSRETNTRAKQSRQEIVERGGSIASRSSLHRAVSRSVPTQRLSSPLNDLPVSPNVTPGMRIPAESLSAMPTTPAVVVGGMSAANRSPQVASPSRNSSVISRSVSTNSTPISRATSTQREGRRSLGIQRKASGIPQGPSDDGTISADALVRMIESGQSIPNQVVHRRVSGTSSSGLIRAQRSPNRLSRSSGSALVSRRASTSEKAAPGPVSILSQVLSPGDDSDSDSSEVTTSQLLDLMDWINRIVDDRLRQELERRGVAGGRW